MTPWRAPGRAPQREVRLLFLAEYGISPHLRRRSLPSFCRRRALVRPGGRGGRGAGRQVGCQRSEDWLRRLGEADRVRRPRRRGPVAAQEHLEEALKADELLRIAKIEFAGFDSGDGARREASTRARWKELCKSSPSADEKALSLTRSFLNLRNASAGGIGAPAEPEQPQQITDAFRSPGVEPPQEGLTLLKVTRRRSSSSSTSMQKKLVTYLRPTRSSSTRRTGASTPTSCSAASFTGRLLLVRTRIFSRSRTKTSSAAASCRRGGLHPVIADYRRWSFCILARSSGDPARRGVP